MKFSKRNFVFICFIIFFITTILILIYVFKLKNKTVVNSAVQTIIATSTEQEKANDNIRGEFTIADDGDIMVATNTNGNVVIDTIDSNMIAYYDIANKTTGYTVNTNKGNTNVTSTEPYIPDEMKVADPNDNSGRKTLDVKFNRNPENVKIEILTDSITNTSVEILITDNNEPDYGWGKSYRIQKNENGSWNDLKTIRELAFEEIAYILDENNQLKQKINWVNLYGELEKGTYRIVKPVYDNGYIDLYSNEFQIN